MRRKFKHREHKEHKVFLGVLCALCVSVSLTFADSVDNVRWSVSEDDKLIIEYDLLGSGEFSVSLAVSTDNGATFVIQPRAVSGDVGEKVAAGRGKRIVWDVYRDMKRLAGTVAVQVTAAKPSVIASPDRVIASEAKQSPLPEMTFVLIPGGSFLMGSNDGDSDEKPVHRVEVKAFYIMTTEVTQRMWQAIMGDNPSYFKGDDLPVECVSWNDCQEFIKKLNQRDPGKGYRLPSEAEWEYACRAGTTTKYYTGDSESDLARTGWYDGNSGSKTHPVGQKQPNAWGLYDMHGNVWEWCADCYHSSYNGAPGDGRAWYFGAANERILRGGSWHRYDSSCRCADRIYSFTDLRSNYFGFRLVRSP